MDFRTASVIACFLILAAFESYSESSPLAAGWGGSSGAGWSSSPTGSFGGSSASGWGAAFHRGEPRIAIIPRKESSNERVKTDEPAHPKMDKFTAFISQE